tara:strand:+ start:182 stop:361 length:180 start_codon:yes stop_codon:yes gene_type:complete
MEIVKQVGIPLLAHANIYEEAIGITFLWIFTLDLMVQRKHIDLTFGIGSLYAQVGMGVI